MTYPEPPEGQRVRSLSDGRLVVERTADVERRLVSTERDAQQAFRAEVRRMLWTILVVLVAILIGVWRLSG